MTIHCKFTSKNFNCASTFTMILIVTKNQHNIIFFVTREKPTGGILTRNSFLLSQTKMSI